MYACMCTQGCVRLGLVLGRHPKINLFVLHYCVTCCEVETKLYIFNIYPKRRREAVAYERLPQSEARLYTEICKSKSIFIFYFQPAKFY